MGILFGFALVAPIVTIFTFGNIYVSLALILFMCLDGFLQLKFRIMSNNWRRLLTGLGFGYGMFSLILLGITKLAFLF